MELTPEQLITVTTHLILDSIVFPDLDEPEGGWTVHEKLQMFAPGRAAHLEDLLLEAVAAGAAAVPQGGLLTRPRSSAANTHQPDVGEGAGSESAVPARLRPPAGATHQR